MRIIRRYGIFLSVCCLVICSFYLFRNYNDGDYNTVQYVSFRFHNSSADSVDGYLVWNKKCHMLSKDPFDPSIRKHLWNQKFTKCSEIPRLTSIVRQSDGGAYLKINTDYLKFYENLQSCCWAPVTRPDRIDDLDREFDSRISEGNCSVFQDIVAIPKDVEVVKVVCSSDSSYLKKVLSDTVYENVHAIIQLDKIKDRSEPPSVKTMRGRKAQGKKLSVLMLGIDSVSRLNFYRSMPLTKKYLDSSGWFELRGYNKIGDNTFPNVMAVLTGQSEEETFAKCKPDTPYGLDNCSIIWNHFKKAGYVTAYGEDNGFINTFNYLKVGFVKPPTDYYLRPYVLAYEDLRKGLYRLIGRYCAGPELAFDRIFDYATEFAKTFIGKPHFGLFWTSSVTHDGLNGVSSIDAHFLAKLKKMEADGVTNDTMIVFFSDHGIRYGSIRNSFIGWYEDRLPFIYIWLPEWFREQNPSAAEALRINRNRLTSPLDLYETLRDVVDRSGGQAPPSSGCPKCSSLLEPVARERGCSDAGISGHWCTCDAFQLASTTDEIVVEGANRFVRYMESIVKEYKNEAGVRLCAVPKLKKINKVQQVVDLDRSPGGGVLELYYSLEVTPGDGIFEVTIRYYGPGNYSIREEEVSRINAYAESAKCLNAGLKKYCHCE